MAIIAISRGTFSGGKAIAESLAARLGCPCISREIINDAAKEFNIQATEFDAALAKPPGFWMQIPGKRVALLNYIRAALLERSKAGGLVYHGFAGHLLLTGVPHVLRVRVIASAEYRIKAAMELLDLNRERAIARINRDDAQSDRWARSLYRLEWREPSIYDVVLNLERITIDGAVQTLAQMTDLPEFKPTGESMHAFHDLLLGSKIWAALSKDPRTHSANIRVEAHDGNVTIAGDASSDAVLKAIPVVASLVKGVGQVHCEVGIGSNWVW